MSLDFRFQIADCADVLDVNLKSEIYNLQFF